MLQVKLKETMRTITCLVLITAFLFLLTASKAISEEKYLMNGKVVSRSMYDALLLLKEGTNKLNRNENAEAIKIFKHAESLAPNFPEVQHNLGIALAKLGKSKEAIFHLEKAKALNPNLASTWLSLGGLYQTEGRINEAITVYKQYIARFPNDPMVSKVSSLVQGLQKEASLRTTEESKEDYLSEITRQGIVRWSASKMPLRIYIADGNKVPGYEVEFEKLLRQSFLDWAKASNNLISFKFVDNQAGSDIQCTWTNNPKDLINIAEAGETNLVSNSKGIVRGKIKFLTVPLVKTLPITKNRMRTIFLHEIGHVLGMAGHTTTPSDAMFFSLEVKDEWRDLTDRDARTIQRLYASGKPAITYKKEP